MAGNTPASQKCLKFFSFFGTPPRWFCWKIEIFFSLASQITNGTPQSHLEDGVPSLCLGRKLKQQEVNEKMNEPEMKKWKMKT